MNSNKKRVRIRWTDASGHTYYAYAPTAQKCQKTPNYCEGDNSEMIQKEHIVELEDLI